MTEVVHGNSSFEVNSQLNSVKVSPFHVVAEVMEVSTSVGNGFISLLELLGKNLFEIFLLLFPEEAKLFVESRAVLLVHGQKPVVVLTEHLNRESIDTVRKSVGTELILPFGEISSFNRRHSISLLPFGQIILIRSWVKTVHLGLQTQDRGRVLSSLQVHLRNKVILAEEIISILNISVSQLATNKVHLSLTQCGQAPEREGSSSAFLAKP